MFTIGHHNNVYPGYLRYNEYSYSPLGETLKNKFRCTPLGTKVAIYHFVGSYMLNSIGNVVNLTTCAEIV